jgi:hypothetical protein
VSIPAIPAGVGAPYSFAYTATSADFDITLATAAEFAVQLPSGGVTLTWTASITVPEVGEYITLTHLFDEDDTPQTGPYWIEPRITIPSGIVVCHAFRLLVNPRFTP